MAAQSTRRTARRDEIVAAAQRVILRAGPAGCTTREVAVESGLNKGLVYYYFAERDEILDAAMSGFADELRADIRDAASDDDPEARLWAVIEAYIRHYEARPGLAIAWFEYLMRATRAERVEPLSTVMGAVISELTTALAATGVRDAEHRGRILLSYVLGVLIRGLAEPLDFAALKPEIANLAAITTRNEGP